MKPSNSYIGNSINSITNVIILITLPVLIDMVGFVVPIVKIKIDINKIEYSLVQEK